MSGLTRRLWVLARWLNPYLRARDRLWLSLAKHRSLAGHPFTALTLSRWVRGYSYTDAQFYRADDAPLDIASRRQRGFVALADRLRAGSPLTLAASEELRTGISDAAFVHAYRVPFQFLSRPSSHGPRAAGSGTSTGTRRTTSAARTG